MLVLVSAFLAMCAIYLSLDSLRHRANALFNKMRPSLISWSESVRAIFDGLDEYKLNMKTVTVAEINSLCNDVNDKLAQLAKRGGNAEELSDRFSDVCGEIFNEVFNYNEAVLSYNKKLSAPLCKAVARLLRIKSPEKLSEIFFQ